MEGKKHPLHVILFAILILLLVFSPGCIKLVKQSPGTSSTPSSTQTTLPQSSSQGPTTSANKPASGNASPPGVTQQGANPQGTVNGVETAPYSAEDTQKRAAEQQQKENQAIPSIKAAGLPVTTVYIIDVSAQEKVLVAVLDYEKMIGGISPGYFVVAGVNALSQLASQKTFDVSGVSYVTVALNDDKGRTISESGVPSADLLSFRAGQMTQQQFTKLIASQVEDRFAAFDAMTGKTKK